MKKQQCNLAQHILKCIKIRKPRKVLGTNKPKNHDVLYDSPLLRKKSPAFTPKGAFEGCIVKSYKIKMLCINE